MNATETGTDRELNTIKTVAEALSELPIIQQLNFVEGLLFKRGGDKTCEGQDPVLIIATEAVRNVMSILEKHPEAAKLTMSD